MGERQLDLNIRQAVPTDSASIARVHVESWRSAYRGIVSEDYLKNLSYSEREQMWSRAIGSSHDIVLVAEDREKHTIIGFASGGANRVTGTEFDSELYAIYLLDEYRGMGIGTMLVSSLAKSLVDRGFKSMLVWVLARNPYRTFYEENLGGQYLRSQEIEIGGEKFEEVSYGWRDIASSLASLA